MNGRLKELAAQPLWEKPGFSQVKASIRNVRDLYCTKTWQRRVLPDLVLVGAQRSGTTALTDALFRMPMVRRPRRGKGSHYFSLYYARGWPWFQGQFPTKRAAAAIKAETGHDLFVFDACPYYLYHPFAVERMAKALPNVKLLVMLRDPVARAESHYHHSVGYGHETLDFATALSQESERLAGEVAKMAADESYISIPHEHFSYVDKGMYARQLTNLFKHYDRDQVLVMSAEAFYADPDATLERLTSWLGLPKVTLAANDNRNANRYQPNLEVRAQLAATFAEPNEQLFALLGERFEWTRE